MLSEGSQRNLTGKPVHFDRQSPGILRSNFSGLVLLNSQYMVLLSSYLNLSEVTAL